MYVNHDPVTIRPVFREEKRQRWQVSRAGGQLRRCDAGHVSTIRWAKQDMYVQERRSSSSTQTRRNLTSLQTPSDTLGGLLWPSSKSVLRTLDVSLEWTPLTSGHHTGAHAIRSGCFLALLLNPQNSREL